MGCKPGFCLNKQQNRPKTGVKTDPKLTLFGPTLAVTLSVTPKNLKNFKTLPVFAIYSVAELSTDRVKKVTELTAILLIQQTWEKELCQSLSVRNPRKWGFQAIG